MLVIDEHGPSVVVLCHALSSRGHTCIGVSSASEAVDCITAFQPDVVFYEWNLGNGEGIGLAKRLRDASTCVTTVIAVSVLNEPDDFRTNEQVDAYVMKPFDAAELESILAPAIGVAALERT